MSRMRILCINFTQNNFLTNKYYTMLKYLIVYQYTMLTKELNTMSLITELHPKDLTSSAIKAICSDHLQTYYKDSSAFSWLRKELRVANIINLQCLPTTNCNCKPIK